MNSWARTYLWAPEVIYDPVGQTINGKVYNYVMFYNGCSYESVVNNDTGAGGLHSSTTTGVDNSRQYLGVVFAETPVGPFIAADNVQNLDGKTMRVSECPFEFTYNNAINSGYRPAQTIDASPFIDSDGQRYLYYCGFGASFCGNSCVYGVKMKDWLTPDYSTVNMICHYGRATVGGASINEGEYINEAPFMIKDGDTYMMTFSTYTYTNVNYQVRLARSSNPLSGFTKVDPNNGGTVINSDVTWDSSDSVRSAGHHAFIKVGDQLFIAYHTFLDGVSIAGGRALAVDECKIIDHNGGRIIVTNGPTKSYQPLPYAVSGYKNIASEATLNVEATEVASNGNDKSVLTDGLLKFHSNNSYTNDYLSGGNVKVTLEFDTYKSVRALMVYLPYEVSYRFQGLKNVVITYNGGTINIDKVALDLESHLNLTTSKVKVPGGAAILEFNDLPVKKIEFMLDNYKRAGTPLKNAGMSEIVVLSNPNGSTAKVTDVNKKYTYLNAEVPAAIKHDQGKVLGSVNVNGTIYHTTYGFANLTEEDDGSVGATVKNSWTNDQYAYFKGVNSDTVYFEGKLNVYENEAYLNDYFPKFGLVLKNYQACSFFYVDAQGNATSHYNYKQVGYTQSKIGGGDWDWNGTEVVTNKYTVGSISYYKGDNWVKLAIARVGDNVKMYCNDVKIFDVTGLRGLGTGQQAACGFLCFNTGMQIKDYNVVTGASAVAEKIDYLTRTTNQYIAENVGRTSDQFGDINSNRKSATTWNTSKDYSSIDDNYAQRELKLESTDRIGNHLYFKDFSDTLYYMEAKFEATGILASDEAWGKFGFWITDYYGDRDTGTTGADKTGVYFYVDASGSGTITGTNVELATVTNGNIAYGQKTANGVYTPGQAVTLGVFRQGMRFVFFVDGAKVFECESPVTGKANPAFASYNIGLKVSDYFVTTDKQNNVIKDNYKSDTDEYGMMTVTFGHVEATRNGWQEIGFTEKYSGGATNTTSNVIETVTYANVSGESLYFEANLSLKGVYNNDGAPKAGILVKTNYTEYFFAIDAGASNGNFTGKQEVCFAYRACSDGAPSGGWIWGNGKVISGLSYTGNASAKMQALYVDGTLYLAVNNVVAFIVPAGSISGLTGGVNVGILGFNLNTVITGAKTCTSTEGLAKVKKDLGFVHEADGITVDGDLSDWTMANTKYSYWDNGDPALGFEVMAKMTTGGVLVGTRAVVRNVNNAQNDWWLNTNLELKIYTPTSGTSSQQAYLNVKDQTCGVGAYAYATAKSGEVYNVYFETFIPYSQIGYTGTEEYVAMFFAVRPGTPATGGDDVDSAGNNWWTGSVNQNDQSYQLATTTYKVTQNGIVFPA